MNAVCLPCVWHCARSSEPTASKPSLSELLWGLACIVPSFMGLMPWCERGKMTTYTGGDSSHTYNTGLLASKVSLGTLLHCWWECKLIQPLWKKVWRFLKTLGIKPPFDPAIPPLGIYPEETKIGKDTCIPLFIAALLTIARTWKQPRCPLTDEWIKKLWYIYTMEYYSAIKRNAFESVLMRWMNLEPIIHSKVSQKEKDRYCILMHIHGI